MLVKEKNNRKFLIKNTYTKKEVSIVGLDPGTRNIPLFYNELTKSIIDKTLNLKPLIDDKSFISTDCPLTKKVRSIITKSSEYL